MGNGSHSELKLPNYDMTKMFHCRAKVVHHFFRCRAMDVKSCQSRGKEPQESCQRCPTAMPKPPKSDAEEVPKNCYRTAKEVPEECQSAANEMAESIAKLSDPVARDAIVHNVATRLGTSAEEIRKRMANLRAPRTNSHRENTDEGNAVTPLRVDNKTVRLFCKLALTDTATKQWLEENQEESEILNDIPDGEILMQIWKGSFDPMT